MQLSAAIPRAFVWSKFGVEAGEPVSGILKRKERERRLNAGIFLWGIGNNVASAIRLLAKDDFPEVLFSPIISAPRVCDISPSEVVVWTKAEGLDGSPFEIPHGSVVTSRMGARKRCHFALVCYSEAELKASDAK